MAGLNLVLLMLLIKTQEFLSNLIKLYTDDIFIKWFVESYSIAQTKGGLYPAGGEIRLGMIMTMIRFNIIFIVVEEIFVETDMKYYLFIVCRELLDQRLLDSISLF